ncbi:MAG TPA: helix-turn-helix domain-containing protein [Stellaceae bacterium]|nr:helix-turn-helix domain-containing protein [Stellaceae bacterium]
MQKLLSKREAAGQVGVHPEHLMRMVRQGQFPKPIRLGDGATSRVRFITEEVEAWVASKVAARDAAGAA